MELDNDPTHKAHRKSKTGVKANKKKAAKQKKLNQDADAMRDRNPKAFSVSSKARKERQIKLDRMHKKEFMPVVDRTPVEPPPVIVAVQGPPGVGKTTLIKCMAKHYTHQAVTDLRGPLTVVSGKKRRVTFIEVPSKDLTAMVDVAKVADLVLMVVDASFGFEMETFEFLNLLQQHGFPKVLGILTHLDLFHKQSEIRKTKKLLKKRFWGEIYQGAKMFYLSGMIHGKYLKRDIKNLARYISVQKYRPLTWRNAHPYLLVDRVEDITNPELIRQNDKCDRKVALFGYLHGTNLKKNQKIHIPGCGDFHMNDISTLDDPCPLPPVRRQRQKIQQKERLMYAPMSNIGQMLYDKDGVYIEIADHQVHFTDPSQHQGPGPAPMPTQGPGEKMVRELQKIVTTVDENLDNMDLMLFSGSKHSVVLADKKSEPKETPTNADSRKPGEKNPNRVAVPPQKSYEISEGDEYNSDEDEDSQAEDEDGEGDSYDSEEDSEDEESEDEESDESMGMNEKQVEKGKKKGVKKMKVESSDDEESSEESDGVSDKRGKNDTPAPRQIQRKRKREDSESQGSEDGTQESEGDGSGDDEDESEDEDGSSISGKEVVFDDDSEGNEGAALRWKEQMREQAIKNFVRPVNLMKLVYGDPKEKKKPKADESTSSSDSEDFFKLRAGKDESDESEGESNEQFFQAKSAKRKRDEKNEVESSRYSGDDGFETIDLEDEEIRELFVSRFIPRDYIHDDKYGVGVSLGGDDENLYGSFEDLEDSSDDGAKKTKEKKEVGGKDKEDLLAAKSKIKEAFDEEYDGQKKQAAFEEEDEEAYFNEMKAQVDEQRQKNLDAFKHLSKEEQIALRGHPAGDYVRIEISAMPCEFIKYFDPRFPVIIGGLNPQEERVGMVQVRLKKHRWYKKVLKTNDPLIISLGWRRFQTQPLYSIRDHNGRNRSIKYTPEHMHCYATFWGPVTPPNTGLVAFQYTYSNPDSSKSFNISATGVVLELNQTFEIVKKLKLVGYPYQIKKNTAFIKDMFNSVLECNKFIGAQLITVAGIRGQIKKAQHTPPGAFRATFEDKVLKSDIIILRTWYPVQPKKFYNPVTDLLVTERSEWQGMKTIYQLRKEYNIPVPVNPDSLYKPIIRRSNPNVSGRIPMKVQAQLPYASVRKITEKKKVTTAESEHAVIMEPEERAKLRVINQLTNIKRQKKHTERQKKKVKLQAFLKEKQREDAKRTKITKENRKEMYRLGGLIKQDKEKRAAKRRRIN